MYRFICYCKERIENDLDSRFQVNKKNERSEKRPEDARGNE